MSKKLLLADDSLTIQKVVELILADEDYEIRAAGDGEEAWNMVKEFRPDVILADIEMPSLNGYQLCERVKKDEETSHIPVILLAGAFEPIDDDLAREVSANDHLVKPFESQELISKLNAIFAEQEISGETGAEVTEEAVEVSEVEAEIAGAGEEVQEEVPEPLEVAEAMEAEETPESIPEAEEIKPEEGEISFESADEDVWNLEEELSFGEDKPEETIELVEPEGEETEATQAEPEGIPVEEVETAEAQETPPVEEAPAQPAAEISLPDPAQIESLIRESIEKKISDALSGINAESLRSDAMDLMAEEVKRSLSGMEIGNILEETIRSQVAERIEQAIQTDLPQKIEGAIRSMMEDLTSSLRQEVEKVLWETVPDLAETLITREIERIKAEF